MESSILNNILLEWAMESDDGLLSGFNSQQNVAALKSLLGKKGIKDHALNEIVSEILATEAQPRRTKADREAAAAADKARRDAINPDEVSLDSLRDIKKLKEYAPSVLEVVDKFPEFKALYNKLSVEEAIDFLNSPKNSQIIEALNGIKGATLGEGEIPMVFLTKNGISGGTKSGDLVVDGKNIDVKKMDKWKFRVELASFAGFSSTEFNAAITELIHFSSDKKNSEVLKKLVDSSDDKDINSSQAFAKSFKETTKNFFDSPDVELFGRGVVMGLIGIGIHLDNLDSGKPASDYADFVIDHDKTTVNVDNSKEIEKTIKQQSIKGPEAQPQTVNVTLSPIDDEESQLIIPKIRRLKYFVNRYGPQSISDSVLPRLHYTDIIFYDPVNKNGKGKSFILMSKDEVVKSYEFYGWAKAPVFILNSTVRPPESYRGGNNNSIK